ncbi:hypothetical protein AB0D40_31995 [Streptomyces massasporeus]
MSRPLPQLPKPEFVLLRIEAPPAVPTRIAVDLGETGIPMGLIGYEYRPLSEPVYVGGIGERGLVAIATSGLFGRIGVDVASGHVVQVPTIESATTGHVNRDIDSFNRCVEAVIARFPFYAEDDEERFEEAAEQLRYLVSCIDETRSRARRVLGDLLRRRGDRGLRGLGRVMWDRSRIRSAVQAQAGRSDAAVDEVWAVLDPLEPTFHGSGDLTEVHGGQFAQVVLDQRPDARGAY